MTFSMAGFASIVVELGAAYGCVVYCWSHAWSVERFRREYRWLSGQRWCRARGFRV